MATPAARDIDVTLLLIGDAGKPAPGGDPVLAALRGEASLDPERTFVAFLGDNVYPSGLPPHDTPQRTKSEQRLDEQIAAVTAAGARGLFIPGNHDWRGGGSAAVIRQEQYVEQRAGARVVYLPGDACPGPSLLDLGTSLRLIVLDTEWFLAKPEATPPTSSCPTASPEAFAMALDEAIDSAGTRRVVVVAHHPLESGGLHGGHFEFKDHVFPLTEVKPWLWLPLPGIGSLYPLARRLGISRQDLSGPANRRMRNALEQIFSIHPPFVYAAGHEHDLQVIEGRHVKHLLVSGGGSFAHASATSWTERTRYAAAASGFMRLDFIHDGRVRLGVILVDGAGTATEGFSEWLD